MKLRFSSSKTPRNLYCVTLSSSAMFISMAGISQGRCSLLLNIVYLHQQKFIESCLAWNQSNIFFISFLMKQTLMLLLYVHIYSIQCRIEEKEGCGEGCSVVKEVLFTNILFFRFSESWFCSSLLNPTKPHFSDVIILVLAILVSSKEYANNEDLSINMCKHSDVLYD